MADFCCCCCVASSSSSFGNLFLVPFCLLLLLLFFFSFFYFYYSFIFYPLVWFQLCLRLQRFLCVCVCITVHMRSCKNVDSVSSHCVCMLFFVHYMIKRCDAVRLLSNIIQYTVSCIII